MNGLRPVNRGSCCRTVPASVLAESVDTALRLVLIFVHKV